MHGADLLAVGLLRVVDPANDVLRARLAADRLLSAARPAPSGLSPEAILVVRSLRDPLPGACEVAPSALAVTRWRAAADARLDEARALASRPASGPVHPAANGVLFDNFAELLACLTIDAAAGVAAARWWWRAWLAGRPVGAVVERVWIKHAAQAPGALELLSARRATETLAQAFSPAAAAAIAVAIARTYDLPQAGDTGVTASTAAAGVPASAAAAGVLDPAPAVDEQSPADSDSPGSEPARRLLGVVPELVQPCLPREHRRLLGLGLTLRRRRSAARDPGYWQALDELAGADNRSDATGHGSQVDDRPARTVTGAEAPASRGDQAADVRSGPVAVSVQPASGEQADPAPAPAPARRGTPSTSSAEARPQPGAIAPAPLATSPGRVAVTDLGGLFMLPSVALHLGLYGDFSRPRDHALDLDPWDLVALLGRALLPRAPRGDVVWELLAELAGRAPGEQPGRGFRAPGGWRLPADWLAPFGPGRGPWRWHAADGRLRARHPAGFLALDVALRGHPAAALLERELRRLGSPPVVHDRNLPVARRGIGAGKRWVATWLAPYVAARLRIALAARRPSAAVALTLRRRARVTLSPARVDVTYALDELPTAIRRAGLDRTPGWIPAAGRHLEIHFV